MESNKKLIYLALGVGSWWGATIAYVVLFGPRAELAEPISDFGSVSEDDFWGYYWGYLRTKKIKTKR